MKGVAQRDQPNAREKMSKKNMIFLKAPIFLEKKQKKKQNKTKQHTKKNKQTKHHIHTRYVYKGS